MNKIYIFQSISGVGFFLVSHYLQKWGNILFATVIFLQFEKFLIPNNPQYNFCVLYFFNVKVKT